jgi:hypothetical protein
MVPEMRGMENCKVKKLVPVLLLWILRLYLVCQYRVYERPPLVPVYSQCRPFHTLKSRLFSITFICLHLSLGPHLLCSIRFLYSTKLQAFLKENHGSVPDRDWETARPPNLLWVPPSVLFNGPGGSVLRDKATRVWSIRRLQLKYDGTRWCTGEEVKGKLANGVGRQYPSHYLGTWFIQHHYRWCAHLGCQ